MGARLERLPCWATSRRDVVVERTVVVTVVHGRHDHLARQRELLAAGRVRPTAHVVVRMEDDVEVTVPGGIDTTWIDVAVEPAGLPLAAARNAGAREALRHEADLLLFLDVDCLPGPDLVGTYQAAAEVAPDAVLCGPVTYLPPPPPEGYDLARLHAAADPHPARPAPSPGDVRRSDAHELFWSLSFATTPVTWERCGGFDEAYVGYGGEDTDFGQRARAAGVDLAWVGGADAFHQHHPVSRPPVEHLDDILRNGALFHARWGWWPMEGWLTEMEALGLVRRQDGGWVAAEAGVGSRPA